MRCTLNERCRREEGERDARSRKRIYEVTNLTTPHDRYPQHDDEVRERSRTAARSIVHPLLSCMYIP